MSNRPQRQNHFPLFKPRDANPVPKRPSDVLQGEDGFEEDERWGNFGVYMQAKKRKLLEQFETESGPRNKNGIFKGVAIFVNGQTNPCADELKRLMALNGGVYHVYESHGTTHVIATNLPVTKIKKLRTEKVVKPEWIVESLKAGMLLKWEDFELYPTEKHAAAEKPVANFGKPVPSKWQIGKVSAKPLYFAGPVAVPAEPQPSTSRDPPQAIPPVAHKAGDPNYLQQFYSRSRLHHLSMWKTESKQLVQALQDSSDGTFPGRDRLKEERRIRNEVAFRGAKVDYGTVVMHVDFDCFFVSVGLLSRPDLVGKPIAVCHGRSGKAKLRKPGEPPLDDEVESFGSRSEVSSCSYEARKAGLKNGMYLGPAKQMCPSLVTIPYDFEKYKEISTTFYQILASYTLDIEAISCDEMIVDCTDILEETGASPLEFAGFVRSEILQRTGCNASAGLGANPLLARLATKKAKPNGQYYIADDAIQSFMSDIPVKDIPGAGYSAVEKFEKLKVTTCGELQKISLKKLQAEFGPKNGQKFYDFARGLDDRDVQNKTLRKSVSADVNYGIRMQKVEEFDKFFRELTGEIQQRMRKANVLGQTMTLKLLVRHPDAPFEPAKYMGCGQCNAVNRSVTLIQATDSVDILAKEGITMFRKMDVDVREVRGIGVQMTRLIVAKGGRKNGAGVAAGIDMFFKPLEREMIREEQPEEEADTVGTVDEPPTEQAIYDPEEDLFPSGESIPCGQPQRTPVDVPLLESEPAYPTSEPQSPAPYDIEHEIGWDRVFRKLVAEVKPYVIKDRAPSVPSSSAVRRNKDFLEKLTLDPDDLDGDEEEEESEMLAGNISDTASEHTICFDDPEDGPSFDDVVQGALPDGNVGEEDEDLVSEEELLSSQQAAQRQQKFFSYEAVDEIQEKNNRNQRSITMSGALQTDDDPLEDEAAQAAFDQMYTDAECKFWLNYFQIPEDFAMIDFPLHRGATLSYYPTPKVRRPEGKRGKRLAPIVRWAFWKFNSVYKRHWLRKVFGLRGRYKGKKQSKLKVFKVTATQAVAQMNRELKLKNSIWREGLEPVKKRKKRAVQLELRFDTQMPSTSRRQEIPPGLPGFSQVDPDFLAALPEDIANEIYVMYQKKDGVPSTSGAIKQKNIGLGKPSKSKKKPRTAARKGRGKAKREKLSASQKSLDGYLKPRKTALDDSFSSVGSREPKKTDMQPVLKTRVVTTPQKEVPLIDLADEMIIFSDSANPLPSILEVPKMKLNKKILTKIVLNGPPTEGFNDAILDHFVGLLMKHRLSHLDFLIKTFYRKIDGLEEAKREEWIESYETIVASLNTRTKEFIGSTLKIVSFDDF